MKQDNQNENVIKLIAHAYPDKPTKQELANISKPRRRVFVENPKVSDYDGLFEEGAELPKGFKRTNTASALVGALVVFLVLFFGIAFALAALF